MSFHWNLSSDEEEEQGLEELWKKAAQANDNESRDLEDNDDEEENDGMFSFLPSASGPSVAKLPSGGFNDFEDADNEDEDDSVNWEDAQEEDNSEEQDGKPAAKNSTDIAIKRPLKAVTIDLDKRAEEEKSKDEKKRPKKARKSYKHASLPQHVRFLLDNLHKTHLLALVSHALFNSSQCSDELLLPVAYSLIPDTILSNLSHDQEATGFSVPSLSQLRDFCQFFFDLANNAEHRLQQTLQANAAAGAPRMNASSRRGVKRNRSWGNSESNNKHLSLDNQLAQGSPAKRLIEYCSYLAMTQSEDPQLFMEQLNLPMLMNQVWSTTDKVNLLIAMARSIGWRARYAVAVEPTKRDLDMNHPIFKTATINVFHAISTWSRPTSNKNRKSKEVIDVDAKPTGSPKKTAKRRPINKKEEKPAQFNIDLLTASGDDSLVVGWVEILSRIDASTRRGRRKSENASGGSRPKMRWVHVDPHYEAFDDPGRAETHLFELYQQREQLLQGESLNPKGLKKRNSGGKSKRRRPVAYVVAVEHYGDSSDSQEQQKRITDVTPRYASSMVESIKLRGITPKQQAKLLSNQGGSWWSKTIKILNASFKGVAGKVSPSKLMYSDTKDKTTKQSGKNSEAAIDITSDNEEPTKQNSNAPHDYEEEEDVVESFEKEELSKSVKNEALPTSKEKFKNHPLYVIPSVMKKTEVLAPDAKKRICGIFKGEKVYSRSDVSEALLEKKWLYKGRKVRKDEMKKPVKRVKGRAKTSKGGAASFKALTTYGVGKENDGSSESERKQLDQASKPLDDGMQDLYAIWQTDAWSPPFVGPSDSIPVNEYKNVELELLNPGLTHIPEPGVAAVAKQLGM